MSGPGATRPSSDADERGAPGLGVTPEGLGSGVRRRTQRWIAVTTSRPVAVLMVFVAVMVFGGFSIRLLPVNLMPDISYPKLTVRTTYPGAAPAEVENNVSRPLEEMLGVVTGLTRIESVSRTASSDVVLEFAWDTDMDKAGQDVLEAIDKVEPLFPDGVEQPLILRYDPTLDPVITLTVSGEGARFSGNDGLKLLRRLADRDIRRLLEPIAGVAAVKVKGGIEEEVEVRLIEEQLRRTGLSADAVAQRLEAENVNLAGGTMRDGKTRYLVRTVNELRDLSDIADVVVVHRDGRDVHLRDIAVIDDTPEYRGDSEITRVDGVEAVEIEVYKEADANIVAMAERVRARIDTKIAPEVKKSAGALVAVSSDRSGFIESSIAEVRNTAIVGGLLAVGMLFIFLRDLRSTLIVAVSIPVSVLVTFAPLSIAGVSLNIMSLGGLAMGIGMLVDNSIVVLESIHRCRQEGDDVIAATLRGTSEVGSAVMASTLTTIAVFFPMVFVEGIAGQMFGDLGLAVVFSLLASLAVALFLIPMLASRQGLGEATTKRGLLGGFAETWTQWASVSTLVESVKGWRGHWWRAIGLPWVLVRLALHLVFEAIGKLLLTAVVLVLAVVLAVGWAVGKVLGLLVRPLLWVFAGLLTVLERAYPPLIRACLRNRVVVYAAFVASLGFIGWGLARVDTELIPQLHQGEFTVELRLPVGTAASQTEKVVAPIEKAIAESVPHVERVTATIADEPDDADTSERGDHTARLRIRLAGADFDLTMGERIGAWFSGGATAEDEEREALAAIREVVADVPDLRVAVSRPVLFSFKTPVEVEIQGHDLDDLAEATAIVAARIDALPGVRDVEPSIQPGSPEVHVIYDRDALARQGLDIRTVAEQLRNNLEGRATTKMTRGDRKLDIVVRFGGALDRSLAEIENIVVNPGANRPVPLSAVAELVVSRGPNEIRRIGQQRVGLVRANVEGVALGGVAAQIEQELVDLELPRTVTTEVTGQSEEWEVSSRSMLMALALSVFLVYVIMASQFESLVYPLVILISIPLALVGVVGTLLVTGIPVSVVVFLGAIMLAGIVVNNAIVLVDYTGRLKARGMSTADALEMAGRVRLRPILMTTLTTMLGLFPMALGLGDGAEIRSPMAVTVIAGLGLSTLLTLVVIPTLYAAVDGLAGGRRLGDRIGEGLERDIAKVTAEQLAPEVGDTAAAEPDPETETETEAETEAEPDPEPASEPDTGPDDGGAR